MIKWIVEYYDIEADKIETAYLGFRGNWSYQMVLFYAYARDFPVMGIRPL